MKSDRFTVYLGWRAFLISPDRSENNVKALEFGLFLAFCRFITWMYQVNCQIIGRKVVGNVFDGSADGRPYLGPEFGEDKFSCYVSFAIFSIQLNLESSFREMSTPVSKKDLPSLERRYTASTDSSSWSKMRGLSRTLMIGYWLTISRLSVLAKVAYFSSS